MHCLSTVTVMSFNRLLCKLHQVSSTILCYGSSFITPQNMQSLNEIQKVLDLPELKIVKPSDTRWLAHEHCVRAVKASYSSIVLTLENMYMKHHMNQELLD